MKPWWAYDAHLKQSDLGDLMVRPALIRQSEEKGKAAPAIHLYFPRITQHPAGLEARFGAPAYVRRTYEKKIYMRTWIWSGGMLQLQGAASEDRDEDDDGFMTVEAFVFDDADAEWLHDLLAPLVSVLPARSYIYIASRSRPGKPIEFSSLGSIDEPLEAGNYSDAVLEQYRKIVADLESQEPDGKIAIFRGPPGTGKTYLLSSIITAAVPRSYVFVSPTDYENLLDAEFFSSLHTQFNDEVQAGRPIVLVLEDADRLLAARSGDPRKDDNAALGGLSAVLNLGDGLLSRLFDVRILATTNRLTDQLDPAIIRDGRVSAVVEVGELSREHALSVLQRLVPDRQVELSAEFGAAARCYG